MRLVGCRLPSRTTVSNSRAVVWGASGGIGSALVKALAASGDYATIYAGSRTPGATVASSVEPFAFDLEDEASIESAAYALTRSGSVDLVIVATGMLHTSAHQPERSFAGVTSEGLTAAFRVNAVGPTLIAKHMIQALPRDRRSVFAALSARVGSIGDNHLGGWHSYRASKAALNMIIANLAIELSRSRPLSIAVGLHPGTVDTNLSLPFQKTLSKASLFSPAQSAERLLAVVGDLTGSLSGAVVDWEGKVITP